jgi:hypothetical protein
MDATGERFAYRCIPLSIANASGWEILCPVTFDASWNGGTGKDAITISTFGATAGDNERVKRLATSHFGHGVLTFHTGYLFRTSPGWALWARGTPNTTKRRIVALEGLVETDWLPMPFTMNWRFNRMGTTRFEAGEPFCFITLVAHALLDAIEPVVRRIEDEPRLAAEHRAWCESRQTFNVKLGARDPETVAERWQRHYVRGANPTGAAPSYHLSKRKLKTPRAD